MLNRQSFGQGETIFIKRQGLATQVTFQVRQLKQA
jgi:hypothetical protein